MEAKFTKGPWRVGKLTAGMCLEVFAGKPSESTGVATCWHTDPGCEKQAEGEANAHLIAAAVDMFEALEFVIGSYDGELSMERAVEAAKTALAKARGEEVKP